LSNSWSGSRRHAVPSPSSSNSSSTSNVTIQEWSTR
jgi:hypothetical protein